MAIFTIKSLDSNALSQCDFRPFLIPIAQIQLKFSFPNPPSDEVHLVVCQRDSAQRVERRSVSLGEQTALPGAVNLDALGPVESPRSLKCFQDSQIEDASEISGEFLLRQNLCTDH